MPNVESTAAATAWERVRSVKPIVLAHREEGERLRRMPDAVAKALLDADLYRLLIPPDLGGLGIDAMTMFDLAVEMASYDGSTGWNFGIGGSAGSLLGSLPLARLREFFAERQCGVAASGMPPGRAVAVEGGYLLTGRWAWASGIHETAWVAGTGVVFEGEKPRLNELGKPDVRFCLVPRSEVALLDTWFTSGMRGTGSTDWEVSNRFVPEYYALRPYTGASVHPAPIFRLPSTFFGMAPAGAALGIARSAIDGLKELVKCDSTGLRHQGYAQYAIAKAEALQESAQLNVRESFRVIWDNTVAEREHTIEQRARVRRGYVHAVESAVEAVNLCCAAAGGSAVFESLPFQRAQRDVNAISGHKVLSRRFMEVAGQAAFGVEFENPLF
jgi:indole-3-acetate monooxygenase